MKTRIFKIFCLGEEGRMYNDTARNLLNEMFTLPRNNYIITIQEVSSYTKSRYKYYWGCIILTAVTQYNLRGKMKVFHKDTKQYIPLDGARLHEHYKRKFNPILEETVNGVIEVAGSTRELTDEQFINQYLEEIMCDLANDNIEIMNFDDWARELKHGATCQTLANSIHYQ